MKTSTFSRRRFLGGLLLTPFLVRCKKDIITSLGATKKKLPSVITDDFLAQYGITELGGKIDAFDVSGTLSGYTDKISYNTGDTMLLYLSGPPATNRLIKFYDANGNTVFTLNADIGRQTINSNKPWVEGLMYNMTASVKIPDNLKSGVYSVYGKIPFVCKSTDSSADITVIFPSNTLNAYNPFGGKSLYTPDLPNRSTVVSSLRYPYYGDALAAGFYRWMDKQNYSVKYVADEDMEDYSQISGSKLLIISGHSEYWTRQARLNVDKFIASGKNVLVLSGNTMYWQVRYDKSKQLMICYKGCSDDPLSDTIYETTNWHLPVLDYPVLDTLGADFENGGYGQQVTGSFKGYKIVNELSPILQGTELKNGDILNLPTFEYDGAPVKKMILPGSTEIPVIDTDKLNCYKVELIGYDFAINGKKHGLGTFIVYQKAPTSGVIVNTASMNWCSQTGLCGGADQIRLQTITKNMIDLSLSGISLFANSL